MTDKDGGAADRIPMTDWDLRDEYAAAALQGLLASGLSLGTPEEAAKKAFIMADAMLKERER